MGGIRLERLALNMDQIRKYGPPPNPAKTTDSRYKAYIVEFGESSWELDALEPRVIAGLIRRAVTCLVDREKWRQKKVERDRGRALLSRLAENWEEVTGMLE
jgi:hypothetical protein